MLVGAWFLGGRLKLGGIDADLAGDPRGEAHALVGLGRCAAAAGHAARAEALLRQAHEIFHRIGAAEAPSVRAELDALISQQPQAKP
jgi:hypothetical protein